MWWYGWQDVGYGYQDVGYGYQDVGYGQQRAGGAPPLDVLLDVGSKLQDVLSGHLSF